MADRDDILGSILGKPYRLGAQGPQEFDCYSATRFVQRELFGRAMPAFTMPETAGRWAIASVIAVHPERMQWREIARPCEGALVTMARNTQGYHIGTWLAEEIADRTGQESRAVVLGHTQRGGTPTAYDRILATRFGLHAVDAVAESDFGVMVALRGVDIVRAPLTEATAQLKTVPEDRYAEAEVFFG
jgi:6-phosphofructokinase